MTLSAFAAPQTVNDGPGVTIDVGSAGLMHRSGVAYPISGRRAKVEGTVLLEAVLDETGNVVDAHVLSGPVELRSGALQSVLQWHFANDTGANTRQVKITFKLPPDTPVDATNRVMSGVISSVSGNAPAGVIAGLTGAPPPPGSTAGKTLKMLRVQGLSDDAKNQLTSRLPVREGDVLSDDIVERVFKAVREYDEHMNVHMMSLPKENGMVIVISAPGAAAVSSPVSSNPVPPTPGVKRITVGGNVQAASLISQSKPEYPALAKQARIQGVVKFAAIVAADGTMRDLQVISGHPLLIASALEAVRQWKYKPTLLEGAPVEVSTQIDVNFTLSEQP